MLLVRKKRERYHDYDNDEEGKGVDDDEILGGMSTVSLKAQKDTWGGGVVRG